MIRRAALAALGCMVCNGFVAEVLADPVRDGSIGPGIELQPQGPDFIIDPAMGLLRGSALLHSFSQFDINPTQSVTFTGDPGTRFVISRITGEGVSQINGRLASSIAGADLYLLNPYGLLIGEQAELSVEGAVYLSSADALSFDTGEQFAASLNGAVPSAAVAAVTAYHFLGAQIGAVTMASPSLDFSAGGLLSVTAGDISIEGAELVSEQGRIQLTSIGSAGTVLRGAQPDLAGFASLGAIVVEDSSLDVSGDQAGTVVIQGQSLTLRDSEIISGAQDISSAENTSIFIDTRDFIALLGEAKLSATTRGAADAGDILLRTATFSLLEEAEIVSDTEAAGDAGAIRIEADSVLISGDAEIASDLEEGSSGNGGSVTVQARTIRFEDAPEISTDSDPDSSGVGGDISLTATESIALALTVEPGDEAGVLSNSEGAGDAGTISIVTPQLFISGGTINAMTEGAGRGGDIDIQADTVRLADGGSITVQSSGSGDAGNLQLVGSDSLVVGTNSVISARASEADGGNVSLSGFDQLLVRQGSVTANVGDGVGGNLTLSARRVILDNAEVVAQAGAGQGGRITIGGDYLFSDASLVSASAGPAGIDGVVNINAPEVDLSADLADLSVAYRDTASLYRQACEERDSGEARGSLLLTLPELEPSTVNGPGINGPMLAQAVQQLLGLADEAQQAGKLALAGQHLLAAQTHLQQAAASSEAAYGLIAVASAYSDLAAISPAGMARQMQLNAASLLQRAGIVSEAAEDYLAYSFAMGNLAERYRIDGQLPTALYLSRRAAQAADQVKAPGTMYRWLAQQGRIQLDNDDALAAISAYRLAVGVIESSAQAGLFQADPTGEYFAAEILPVYQSLVTLLLEQGEIAAAAQAQRWLREARDVMEQLKAAELRDYFQDECVARLQAATISLDRVAADAAIIYPIVLPDRLALLVSTQGQLRHYSVDVNPQSLANEVAMVRRLLEEVDDDFLEISQRLYDWIMRPVVEQLREDGIQTLVFINDGPLRGLPVAALHDGERYLLEDYAIAVAPGLNLVSPGAQPLSRSEMLLAGLSQSVSGFSALPNVPEELAAIAIGPEVKILLDENFGLESIQAALAGQSPSVIHIASHAAFAPSSGASFVLAWDGRLTMPRLANFVTSTRFRTTPLELLVLSACETAVGDSLSALGLAGLAVQAGARSALGSLWTISDEATSRLMIDFYNNMAVGMSKAEALRRAQQVLLADPAYSHPFFWSPFLLINNWM